MTILEDYVNPYYLSDEVVRDIRQSVLAKPFAKYVVLDNFYQIDKIEKMKIGRASCRERV